MPRVLFGLLGIVIALFPAQVRELYEQFAFKNPDEATAKPSFQSAIRTEGLIFVLISVIGGKTYDASMYALGLAGAIALFVPKQALRFSMNYSYDRPETIEWNDGLITVIRCFGVLYLLLTFNALNNRRKKN
jgi:hypothetical protein